ncbi:hypothetical protein AAC387_Pa06g2129 [Persea americana]
MWEERWNSIIDGEPDNTAHHSDEYLAWYKGITCLRIGRGTGAMDASRNVVEDQSVIKMMDEWFKNVQEKATDSHCFPSNLADLYIHSAEHLYYTAFGVEAFLGRRFSQFRTLIFPIVRNQHFLLIIGYVDRGRFEYYNSIMGRDGDRQFAQEFVVFLKSCFMGLGWDDPSSWPLEDAENCPQQENINDCGIFVMAYAEHAAYRREEKKVYTTMNVQD